MRRTQKVTAVVSLVIILVLAAALGLFLWTEERKERDGQKAQETIAESGQEAAGETDGEAGEDSTSPDSSEGALGGISEEEPENLQEEQEMLETQEPEITDVTMMFTGDVMLGSSVLANYDSAGLDGILSEYLQTELQQADLTVINEEFPFSSRGTPSSSICSSFWITSRGSWLYPRSRLACSSWIMRSSWTILACRNSGS